MQRWMSLAIVSSLTLVHLLGAAPLAAEGMFPASVASGDPKSDSVILWTRVVDPAMPDALSVEVATDSDFADIVFNRQLTVSAENDWCIKVRATGLQPYTTYYYRFVYGSGAAMETSRVGRTKTAPTPEMDVSVKFAVVYCQDYIGRYYNAYAKLLNDHDEDIDFVVHLGDIIYETTGDPSFQDPSSERKIEFSDTDGAIALGDPTDPYYAAASLSNYREIYSAYRSDPAYQEVHERWPMIVTWDDHEFSNDAWGATATYFNGRSDEESADRKRNAERAFFEWVPTEVGVGSDGLIDINDGILWPNTSIHRDYPYGSNLHLVLTDTRTNRPDHLVPEDAFPGTMVMDEPMIRDTLGDPWFTAMGDTLDPYVDMSVLGAYLPILRQTTASIAAQAYMAENPALDFTEAIRLAESQIAGNVSTTYINALYEAAGINPPFNPEVQAMLPRGLSYLFMGKTNMYSSSGSRNILFWDPFQLYAIYLYQEYGYTSQHLFGDQQTAWLAGVLTSSDATWTVVGNSIMNTPLLVDFTHPLIAPMLPPDFPDTFKTRMLLTADQWDGFPMDRRWFLDFLKHMPGTTVLISGDIHATFVTSHGDGLYEFTGPAVSSGTFGDLVERAVLGHPILGQIPGIEILVAMLPQLLQASTLDSPVINSTILYDQTTNHGYMIMDATPETITATLQEIDQDEVFTNYYDDPVTLDGLFTTTVFTLEDGILRPGP